MANLTTTDRRSLFPVPYEASGSRSWRDIAMRLRNNALAGFPPNAFNELAVRRSFVGRQQIILSDPAGIRHVLIDNPDNYRRTPAIIRLLGPPLGNGLLFATGEDWRNQRRAAAPAFAPRMMPAVAAHVAQAADKLAGQLAAYAGAPLDLFAHLQLLALEVAAQALFSVDITHEGPQFRAELRHYADGIGRPGLLDFMLPRGLPTPRSWARWRFRRRWMARIARILATRQAEPLQDPPHDLFDMMRAAGSRGGDLVEQAATMLVAGHETTAVALFWACHILSSLPEMQQRIVAEAAPLDLSPAGAAAALPQLAYTRAVIDETLRLYPPAFSIVRQARAPDDAAGTPIPARAVVLIVPWVLHRHSRLWRDPDRFDPGRFLPDAVPPERFSYLPFGAGPRACIGAQFALTEAVLALARLVRSFHIELADDQRVLPLALITLQPDRPALFRLLPR